MSQQTPKRLKFQFGLRHLLFAMVIVAGATSALVLGVSRSRHNIEANKSTYAARLVAQMCVEHMKSNNQSWPHGWDDLQDDFEPCLARSGQTWTFAELKKRVGIDWETEPKNLREKGAELVIWVASDPGFSFYGTTPNEIILRYLESADPNGR